MGNSTAYDDFDALLFWQEFLPNNNGPKYLPEPKTDEERAASIRIIEEERQIGNTVILLDADDYALFYKRLEWVFDAVDEEFRENPPRNAQTVRRREPEPDGPENGQ